MSGYWVAAIIVGVAVFEVTAWAIVWWLVARRT